MTYYSINGVKAQRMYDGIPVYDPPYPLYMPPMKNLRNVKYDTSSMDVTLGGRNQPASMYSGDQPASMSSSNPQPSNLGQSKTMVALPAILVVGVVGSIAVGSLVYMAKYF